MQLNKSEKTLETSTWKERSAYLRDQGQEVNNVIYFKKTE